MRREAANLERRVQQTTSPDRSSGLGGKLSTVGAVMGYGAYSASQAPHGSGGLFAGREEQAIAGSAVSFGKSSVYPVAQAGALGMGAGPAGATMGIAGAMAFQAAKMPGLLKDWSEALIESKRGLVQFNGTIAMAFAEEDRRSMVRGMESGKRTGGAVAGLSDAYGDLKDALQPFKDVATIGIASTLEVLVRNVTVMVTIMTHVAENIPGSGALKELLRQAGERDKSREDLPLHKFIDQIANRPVGSGFRVPPRK